MASSGCADVSPCVCTRPPRDWDGYGVGSVVPGTQVPMLPRLRRGLVWDPQHTYDPQGLSAALQPSYMSPDHSFPRPGWDDLCVWALLGPPSSLSAHGLVSCLSEKTEAARRECPLSPTPHPHDRPHQCPSLLPVFWGQGSPSTLHNHIFNNIIIEI